MVPFSVIEVLLLYLCTVPFYVYVCMYLYGVQKLSLLCILYSSYHKFRYQGVCV